MRFKFCGNGDAPEWFLLETVFLAQISAVRFKLIALAVYRHLLGQPLDTAKLARYLSVRGAVTEADIKALVAAVSFILVGGAKHDVAIDDLKKELIQLGLPREHGVMLSRAYERYSGPLAVRLKSQTLRINKLRGVQWRVDKILATSNLRNADYCEGQLQIAGEEQQTSFVVSHDMLNVLLWEAKQALQVMTDAAKK